MTTLVVFGFVVLVSKIVLGLVAVWALLPDDGRCAGCDEETIRLQHPSALRVVYRMCRVHLRWCPMCDDVHHSRRLVRGGHLVTAADPQPARTS